MAQPVAYAIDVGTTKVVAIAGRVHERRDGVEVTSVGEAPSHGLRRGVVVDYEEAARSVAEAVERCGVRGEAASVGIAGGHIYSFNTEVTLLNRSRGLTITEGFLDRLRHETRQVELKENERLIHVVPRDFVLDGSEGILKPAGLQARRVTMRAHVVTGAVSSIQNLLRAVEECGVKVGQVVLEPLAAAEACLSVEEREEGVALLDIGGGTSDIAAFVDGTLTHTAVVPIGGESFSSDVAYGLKVPVESAEQLKVRYGTALSRIVDPVAPMKLGSRHYNAHFMSQILEHRAREVMEFVRDSLHDSRVRSRVGGGLVLTGGGSQLDGIVDLAEEIVGLPARATAPLNVRGEVEAARKPQYSTAVGLLHFSSTNDNRAVQREGASKTGFGSIVAAIKSWFRGG